MNDKTDSTAVAQTPVASRREFIKTLAAAGSAATLPAAAYANGSADPSTRLLTDQQQLETCIDQLKIILARMHPGLSAVRGDRIMHGDGGSSVLVTDMPPRCAFDGEGLYDVEKNGIRYPVGVYWISREWSNVEQAFRLYGALYWDGKKLSPREIIAPASIIRKLKGGAV